MIAFYIISILSFLGYVIWTLIKYGVPGSLSETYYLLPSKINLLFYMAMLLTAFPILIFWLDIAEGTSQFLVFLSCSGLIFVGTAPKFKTNFQGKVHSYSAYGAAALSSLWTLIYSPYFYVLFILIVIGIVLGLKIKGKIAEGYAKNSLIYFMEMAAFLNIFLNLILIYLSN